MDELRDVQTDVAVRCRALEDRELQILASAVGDHPLPPERRAELDQLHAQRAYEFRPTSPR